MAHFTRNKPQPSGNASNQRASQAAAFDAVCKARPLRPPTSIRPEVRVLRKPLPPVPKI